MDDLSPHCTWHFLVYIIQIYDWYMGDMKICNMQWYKNVWRVLALWLQWYNSACLTVKSGTWSCTTPTQWHHDVLFNDLCCFWCNVVGDKRDEHLNKWHQLTQFYLLAYYRTSNGTNLHMYQSYICIMSHMYKLYIFELHLMQRCIIMTE